MTATDIRILIEEYNEYKRIAEELKVELTTIENKLKGELKAMDTEEYVVPDTPYIVRNTTVISNRFDSTAFKKSLPELYKAYTKQVVSHRFTISA